MADLFSNADTDDLGISEGDNPMELLVGEGKKFKTVEELARGKLESDRFIQRLLDEKKALLEDLQARQRLEELVDKIGSQRTDPPASNQTNHNGDEGDEGNRSTQPVDIEELVNKALTRKQQEELQTKNQEFVAQTLTNVWGPNFANKLLEEGRKAGLTKDEINSLAATKPQLLMRAIGVDANAAPQRVDLTAPPASNANSGAFKPNTGQRTQSYYTKLRRENPSLYHSPAIQRQEYEDAMRLKEAFFD